MEAFERALGPNLRIVRLEQPANYRTDPEPYHPHLRTFLEEVAGREAAHAGLTFEYTWIGLALGAMHSDSFTRAPIR